MLPLALTLWLLRDRYCARFPLLLPLTLMARWLGPPSVAALKFTEILLGIAKVKSLDDGVKHL